MPVIVQNTSESPISPGKGIAAVAPGDTFKYRTYPEYIPDGLTIIEHLPAPWITLASQAPPISLDHLSQYAQLIITNQSGADIAIQANGDDGNGSELVANDNKFPIISGYAYPLSLNDDVWSLDITGEGIGIITVCAIRKVKNPDGKVTNN